MDYFNVDEVGLEITIDSEFITADNNLIFVSAEFLQGHSLKFIPREYTQPTTIKIYDELKNTQFSISLNSFFISDFIEVFFDFEFRIKASYQIEVFSNENLIYRSKAKAI
jgi:hypothetical protein